MTDSEILATVQKAKARAETNKHWARMSPIPDDIWAMALAFALENTTTQAVVEDTRIMGGGENLFARSSLGVDVVVRGPRSKGYIGVFFQNQGVMVSYMAGDGYGRKKSLPFIPWSRFNSDRLDQTIHEVDLKLEKSKSRATS